MNVSARRPARGFSLVELLVTIVIAGLAFAALVPVMVQAINTGSGDRMRVLAVNAAQDRIEKIRQIDFDQITVANLSSTGFYFGQFGPTWTEMTAAGTRSFNVAYSVVDKQVSATDVRIAYKVVKITVDWTGRPTPIKPVVLSTMVYRQYAGPQIVDFSVAPYDATQDWITSSTVDLTATINAADIPSMEPVTVGASTLKGRVEFTISSAAGTAYPKVTVYYDAAHPATYTTQWLAPGGAGVADGYYNFKAVAYSATYYPGNTWQFSKRIESGPPAAVTNLTSQAMHGVAQVILSWTGSVSGDLDHYVVLRTLGAQTDTVAASLPKGTPGFTDTDATGLVADENYTYTVRAVDQLGNFTDASVGVTWIVPPTPPDPAQNLKGAQGSPSVAAAVLSWDPPAAITDPILGYQVYAAGNGTTPVATVTSTTATIPQNWNTTQWYQVKPYVEGGLVSDSWASIATTPPQTVQNVGGAPWVVVTIGAQPTYTLNVVNDAQSGKTATITLYYLGPTGTDPATQVGSPINNVAYNGQATWTNLVAGWYRWAWKTSNNKTGQRQGQLSGTPYIVTVYCIK